MRIKKILANNYNEALTRVKEEMGADALVLKTRSIKFDREGGDQCSSMVEITAAMEDAPPAAPETRTAVAEPTVALQEKETNPLFLENDDSARELRSMVYTLLTETERAKAMGMEPDQWEIYNKLVESGVGEKLARSIFKKFNLSNRETGTENQNQEAAVAGFMEKAIKCAGGIQLIDSETKVVALVGPTGSGKTTTTAKLAAHFSLLKKKKVAMVSLDTFRLGAVEQLQMYGDLMRVPVEVAADKNEFSAILEKHKNKDLILVDTMGRNPKETQYGRELKEIFDQAPNLEIHLVQSVITQEKIMDHSIKQFEQVGIDRILLTKLDEGFQYGHLFNVAVQHQIPFSYMTTGQRVPEDIEVAERDRLIRLIFN